MLTRRRLFILGAGDFGIELANSVIHDADFLRNYELCGILHHGPCRDVSYIGTRVVGDWMDFPFEKDDAVLLGTANIEWKKKLVAALDGKVEFATYFSYLSGRQDSVKIGRGCVILENCGFGHLVEVGDFVSMNPWSRVGHDSVIGSFSTFFTRVDVAGNVKIGEEVLIGTGSIIAPKVKVGKNAKISIGSVVIGHVSAGDTVMGNPARVVFESGSE